MGFFVRYVYNYVNINGYRPFIVLTTQILIVMQQLKKLESWRFI